MMSLEFIRNATVTGDRVAAMTAKVLQTDIPVRLDLLDHNPVVRFPGTGSRSGQVADQIARGWTDRSGRPVHEPTDWRAEGPLHLLWHLLLYAFWGLVILWFLPASQSPDRGRSGQPGRWVLDLGGPV